jgi:hypothetical protein
MENTKSLPENICKYCEQKNDCICIDPSDFTWDP